MAVLFVGCDKAPNIQSQEQASSSITIDIVTEFDAMQADLVAIDNIQGELISVMFNGSEKFYNYRLGELQKELEQETDGDIRREIILTIEDLEIAWGYRIQYFELELAKQDIYNTFWAKLKTYEVQTNG